MRLYCDLSHILFDDNVKEQPEQIAEQVIAYAIRHNDLALKEKEFSFWRSYLMENNLIHELSELYTKKYPDEFRALREKSPAEYCRLNAFISEADGHPDSAVQCYVMTEENINAGSHNEIFTANFFRRYGQFLLRRGDTAQAKEKFLKSYTLAVQARYYPYVIEATKYLEAISIKDKDYHTAYEYEKQNRLYADSLATTARQDELLLMEIDNKNRQAQLEEEKIKAQNRPAVLPGIYRHYPVHHLPVYGACDAGLFQGAEVCY